VSTREALVSSFAALFFLPGSVDESLAPSLNSWEAEATVHFGQDSFFRWEYDPTNPEVLDLAEFVWKTPRISCQALQLQPSIALEQSSLQ
jgi:hypothetical protein